MKKSLTYNSPSIEELKVDTHSTLASSPNVLEDYTYQEFDEV